MQWSNEIRNFDSVGCCAISVIRLNLQYSWVMDWESSLDIYVVTTKDSVGEERRHRLSRRLEGSQLIFVSGGSGSFNAPTVDQETLKFLNGTVGCSRSHIQAWQHFIESGNSMALFLEDDVVFRDLPRLEQSVKQVTNTSSESPILIQWGWLELGGITLRRLFAAGLNLLKWKGSLRDSYVRGYGFGNHCYVINRSMALYLTQLICGVESLRFKDGKIQNDLGHPGAVPLDYLIMTLVGTRAFAHCIVLRSLYNYAVQEGGDSNITNEFNEWDKYRDQTRTSLLQKLRSAVISLSEANQDRMAITEVWKESEIAT